MSPETFRNDWFPLRDGLYRAAYRLLGSEDEAEDAVQDLYLKIWQLPDELISEVKSPMAYCLRLLKNNCLDRLKSKRISGRYPLDILKSELGPEDTRARDREQEKAVLKAVEALPEKERIVLKLKVLDELSYEQIQEKTGIAYLSLRVLLSNARKRIKKITKAYEN